MQKVKQNIKCIVPLLTLAGCKRSDESDNVDVWMIVTSCSWDIADHKILDLELEHIFSYVGKLWEKEKPWRRVNTRHGFAGRDM